MLPKKIFLNGDSNEENKPESAPPSPPQASGARGLPTPRLTAPNPAQGRTEPLTPHPVVPHEEPQPSTSEASENFVDIDEPVELSDAPTNEAMDVGDIDWDNLQEDELLAIINSDAAGETLPERAPEVNVGVIDSEDFSENGDITDEVSELLEPEPDGDFDWSSMPDEELERLTSRGDTTEPAQPKTPPAAPSALDTEDHETPDSIDFSTMSEEQIEQFINSLEGSENDDDSAPEIADDEDVDGGYDWEEVSEDDYDPFENIDEGVLLPSEEDGIATNNNPLAEYAEVSPDLSWDTEDSEEEQEPDWDNEEVEEELQEDIFEPVSKTPSKRPSKEKKTKNGGKKKSAGNPIAKATKSVRSLRRILRAVTNPLVWLSNLVWGAISTVLGILAGIPLIGKPFGILKTFVNAFPKPVKHAVLYGGAVAVAMSIGLITPPGATDVELPDNGAVSISDAKLNGEEATMTLTNEGDTIAYVIPTIGRGETSLFKPATWFNPEVSETCEGSEIELGIDEVSEISFPCALDTAGFGVRVVARAE